MGGYSRVEACLGDLCDLEGQIYHEACMGGYSRVEACLGDLCDLEGQI